MAAPAACPQCGQLLTWIAQYSAWYCYAEKQYRQPAATQPPPPAAVSPGQAMWYLPAYRIRRKVIAIAQQYWIEDAQGHPLAYSRQKLLRIKEDIRVFTDDRMTTEVFRIKQVNWTDAWGQFAVIDSMTNQVVGTLRRKAIKSMVRGEWEMFDAANQLVGGIRQSTGRGLVKRFVPGGGLVPDRVTVQFNGQTVATIDEQFKIVGDVWEINAQGAPPSLDRRVLLSCALLMGMIEREQERR